MSKSFSELSTCVYTQITDAVVAYVGISLQFDLLPVFQAYSRLGSTTVPDFPVSPSLLSLILLDRATDGSE